MNWTEKTIAAELALNHFACRHLVVVPNCNWAGYEADLLVVTKALKLLDFEIKISRADFKADAKKHKWVDRVGGFLDERTEPRLHPRNIWKHYYVMPEEIYDPSLDDLAASPASGIILLHDIGGRVVFREVRKAKGNRDYSPITAQQTLDIARLASLRLWNQIKKAGPNEG